jgi:hypothetical protein
MGEVGGRAELKAICFSKNKRLHVLGSLLRQRTFLGVPLATRLALEGIQLGQSAKS